MIARIFGLKGLSDGLGILVVWVACLSVPSAIGGTLTISVLPTEVSHCLRITVTNQANTNVEIPLADLPWGDRYSLMVVGLPATREATPLGLTRIISIPLAGDAVLKPKEGLSAEIDLRHYVEGFDPASRRSAMHVFWAWVSAPSDATDSRPAGMVTISKATAGEPRTCNLQSIPARTR
jgi:hypothetical protein